MTHLVKHRLNTKYLPATFTLCVRWAPTKPRWAPPAKTKQFRVIPRCEEQIPGEFVESVRLYRDYKAHLKGAINLLKGMYRESEISQEVIDAQEKEKDDCWQEALRVNEEWNRKVGMEREELDRRNFENEVLKAQEKMRQVDEKKQAEQERIDNMIREQEELSKTFITPDKLDEHVEKILNSKPHSFSFALDLQGNIYDDFSVTPTRHVTEDGEFIPVVPKERTRKERTRNRI